MTIIKKIILPSEFLWTAHGHCSYIAFLVLANDLLPHVHTRTLQTEETLECTFEGTKNGVRQYLRKLKELSQGILRYFSPGQNYL